MLNKHNANNQDFKKYKKIEDSIILKFKVFTLFQNI